MSRQKKEQNAWLKHTAFLPNDMVHVVVDVFMLEQWAYAQLRPPHYERQVDTMLIVMWYRQFDVNMDLFNQGFETISVIPPPTATSALPASAAILRHYMHTYHNFSAWRRIHIDRYRTPTTFVIL